MKLKSSSSQAILGSCLVANRNLSSASAIDSDPVYSSLAETPQSYTFQSLHNDYIPEKFHYLSKITVYYDTYSGEQSPLQNISGLIAEWQSSLDPTASPTPLTYGVTTGGDVDVWSSQDLPAQPGFDQIEIAFIEAFFYYVTRCTLFSDYQCSVRELKFEHIDGSEYEFGDSQNSSSLFAGFVHQTYNFSA